MAGRDVAKEQLWRQVVEGHAGSGLSVRRYCADRGVTEVSFFAWRRELAKRDAAAKQRAKSSTGRASVPRSRRQPTKLRFAKLQIRPSELAVDVCIEIVLSAGTRVRVPRGACPTTLRNVLAALERPSC